MGLRKAYGRSLAPVPSQALTGRELRAERARRGLTQAELAVLVGVRRQRITAAEAQYRVARQFGDRLLEILASLPVGAG
jgi:transcriptional regulator with XRE-family HTH domain